MCWDCEMISPEEFPFNPRSILHKPDYWKIVKKACFQDALSLYYL